MSTPISVSAFNAYRRGFLDGAGGRPRNTDSPSVVASEDYERGWACGREAFRVAMEAERERLGMGPAGEGRREG